MNNNSKSLTKSVSRSNILKSVSHEHAFTLLRTIALASGVNDSDIIITKSRLTRRQYYSRLADFMRVGLVKRKNSQYFLTTLGRIVYNNQLILESTLANYWKLKAIDSIELASEISTEERQRFIDSLIDDNYIKQVITNEFSYSGNKTALIKSQ